MNSIRKAVRQLLSIMAIATVLALVVNAIRPDGLPLVQAGSGAVQLDAGSEEIPIKDAAMLFISQRAVFLDARSPLEFDEGHIQGALSAPVEDFEVLFDELKPALAGKEAVITYCDGERCPLSHELAEQLRSRGVRNVWVLRNGWGLWQKENLPVASGKAEAELRPKG